MENREFLFPYILPVIDIVSYLTIWLIWQSVSLSKSAFVSEVFFPHFNVHILERIIIFYALIGCWDFLFHNLPVGVFTIFCLACQHLFYWFGEIFTLCSPHTDTLSVKRDKNLQINYPSLWCILYFFCGVFIMQKIFGFTVLRFINFFMVWAFMSGSTNPQIWGQSYFSIIFLEKFYFLNCDLQSAWNVFCSNFVSLPYGKPSVLVPLTMSSISSLFI